MQRSEDVLKIFPLLLPSSSDFSSYRGMITIHNREFSFEIIVSPGNDLKNARLLFDPELQRHFTAEDWNLITQYLLQSRDVLSFLKELKHFLERVLNRENLKTVHSPLAVGSYYKRLVTELNEVGWHNVVDLNSDLTQIVLRAHDSKQREHLIRMKLPQDYPLSAPQCYAELPEDSNFTLHSFWNPKSSTLSDILKYFQEQLERYQDVWNMLDDIDQNLWVLEPEHPTRSQTTRRVAVVKRVSLIIELSPTFPRLVPTLKFLGSETSIAPLQEKFTTNISLWNTSLTTRENLELILGVKFLKKETSALTEDFNSECAICYAYKLNDKIPDRNCDNSQCSRPYHSLCLLQWLQNKPNSKHSYNTIFGNCPYCDCPISVKVLTPS